MSIRTNIKKGFSFVELVVSMAILLVLFALVTINISPQPSNALQVASLDTLISDIRSQQTLSMSKGSPYGVHFETDSYTLFKGSTYTQGLSGNFIVNLDSGIVFSSVTFPNNIVVFSAGNGDLANYQEGLGSFTLVSLITNKTNVIKINKYGAAY